MRRKTHIQLSITRIHNLLKIKDKVHPEFFKKELFRWVKDFEYYSKQPDKFIF